MNTISKHATIVTGVVLLGLVAAVSPKIGFAQDVNEPAVADANTSAALDVDVSVPEATSEPARKTRSANDWATYAFVTQNNVFSNARRPPGEIVDSHTGGNTPPPPPEPETYFVLRGITDEDGTLTAFFENTQGEGVRVHQGDQVCRGKIASLTLDQAVYERPDVNVVTTVALGQDLQGGSKAVAYSRPTRSTTRNTTQARSSRNRQQPSMDDIQSMFEGRGFPGMEGGFPGFGGFGGDTNSGRSMRSARGGRGGSRTSTDSTSSTATPTPQMSEEERQSLAERMAARRREQTGGN